MNPSLQIPSAEELPLPEKKIRAMGIASRSTFQRWEQAGLRILKIGGQRYVYPSELKDFMNRMDQKSNPSKSFFNCDGHGR